MQEKFKFSEAKELIFFSYNFLEECVDMRKDSCYLNYDGNQCNNPMAHSQTKMLCCCSMGAAWGHPCEKCPADKTRWLLNLA